ncbi:hypothetical protein CROQUDRAFT_664609 [Cronartium quercuum f. sp. fusiforme G11]|uniref:J domain-containing protein n=1 Tax=Cronartium quercuum f. sp. fusiforme G11 TaxID=708437 RepID=A0A9P6NAQ9_9BASI|nr:hypothetical protein CROQUDRAFT_664609 [Cronartium quercuum f. sp. fusiforme G11]
MSDPPARSCIPPDSDFTFTSIPSKPASKPTSSTPSKQSTPNKSNLRFNNVNSASPGPKVARATRSTKNSTGPTLAKTNGSWSTTKPTKNGEVSAAKGVSGSPSSPTPGSPQTPEVLAEEKKAEGNVQFRLKKYPEAVALYTEAVKLDPTNAAYLTNRAAALMALKRYGPALSDMQLAISPAFSQSEPDGKASSKNILRLVRCLVALGQLFQARQALTNLLNAYPGLAEGVNQVKRLGELEKTLTSIQTNRARQDWSMVLFGIDRLQREVEGGTLISKEWIGWKVEALCGKKRWEEAQSLSIDLVRNHTSDPEALYYRALVMYLQGNLSGTITHCQEALRCDPDFTKARNLLRQSRSIETAKEAGNTAFKAADYSTAIEKYLQAAAIDPKNESLTVILDSNRAQSLYKMTRCREAIEVCSHILKIDDKHFKALRTRARAQVVESEFDAAIADFQNAAKHAPSEKDKAELMREIKLTKVKLAKSKYKDHYEILGVSRHATDDEIKKAFRKQSLIHHPDKGGNEDKFKEINESYTVLQNPTTRRQFDMVDPDDPSPSCRHGGGFGHDDDDEMNVNMADLFGASFGGGGGGGGRFRPSSNGFGSSSFFMHTSGY